MKLQELEPDERQRIRQVVIKPLVEAYFTWVRQNMGKVLQKSKDLERFHVLPEIRKVPESISLKTE